MKIAIIGTGNIGARLAISWKKKEHEIVLGVRNLEEFKNKDALKGFEVDTIQNAVAKSDIILLSPPANVAYAVAKSLGDTSGKIIIDAMNAVFRKPDPYLKTSDAVIAALGHDHIVKAFNSIGAENMDNPFYGNDVADMLICGNYPEDKKIVSSLAEDIGFNVYDVGTIEKEMLLENMALVWSSLAFGAGLGRNIAFKILKR